MLIVFRLLSMSVNITWIYNSNGRSVEIRVVELALEKKLPNCTR